MWKKRDSEIHSVDEYFRRKHNIPNEEFLKGKDTDTYHIGNENIFAQKVNQYKKLGKCFHIIGDYDVDGVTSLYIMEEGLKKYGCRVTHRIPHRFSEGYGINQTIIEEIEDPANTVVVTVDNGIAATECMELLKEKNIPVLLTDHHLPNVEDGKTILPFADVIVNPHVTGGDYEEYCGAGVALKLMKILNGNVTLEQKVAACIGTIADVVELTGDNREIVKEGLKILNEQKDYLSAGFQALLSVCNKDAYLASDIAYGVSPMLNAPGRLKDNGAEEAFNLLSTKGDMAYAVFLAVKVKEDNERRKESEKYALDMISENMEEPIAPIVVYIPDIGEGIIGLIAAKLCEKYRMPAICFTNAHDDILKGSGRAPEGFNLKEFLDQNAKWFVKYGGHGGAAGMSIKESNFTEMKSALKEAITFTPNTDEFYDLEVDPTKAMDVIESLRKYEPFGKGNEKPVTAIISNADKYFLMGKEKEHIKVISNNLDMVAFNKAKDIMPLLGKKTIYIGNLSENNWNGNIKPQFIVSNCENL